MTPLFRVAWARDQAGAALALGSREWLVTNGLGGYASGTAGGRATRRFHGALVGALASPHGRTMLLNDVTEEVVAGATTFALGGEESLEELRFELGLPVWRSERHGVRVEKTVVMPHGQNTTYLGYRVLGAPPPGLTTLRLRPWFHVRPHEGRLDAPDVRSYDLRIVPQGCEVLGGPDLPPIRLAIVGAPCRLVLDGGTTRMASFSTERARGYDCDERLWSPGFYEAVLEPGAEMTLVASAESWELVGALGPSEARAAELDRRRCLLGEADPKLRNGLGAELVLAADQFIINPRTRHADVARAHATGHEPSTIIAGYHWFTDWGRDTMISLEGLTLATGRRDDAASILRTFARHVKDGLIPNLFPEGESEGLYHTADASLWFFHAVHRYVTLTGDHETLAQLLPALEDIVAHHVGGTRFGIGVDPADGLLRQGADGYQLTWMDAKVGDWVVTPRRGKAVEINALWYNALRLLEAWVRASGRVGATERARELAARAEHAFGSFNRRFWYEPGGHLFDVIDGPNGADPALRPNQILAISLDHPVLAPHRWGAVVDIVGRALVTPVGLRSLARAHPDYKPAYDGDLRARDAAYHQGTVWAWLLGPFHDAYRRARPDDADGRAQLLVGFGSHLSEACVGTISEIFDAEPPFSPRGCVAQAWSVAELVRCLIAP